MKIDVPDYCLGRPLVVRMGEKSEEVILAGYFEGGIMVQRLAPAGCLTGECRMIEPADIERLYPLTVIRDLDPPAIYCPPPPGA